MWVESSGMIKHRFVFPVNIQLVPSECKGHVHVSQHRVRFEYIVMQQTFPENFPAGTNSFKAEQAFANFFTFFFRKALDPLVVSHTQVPQ